MVAVVASLLGPRHRKISSRLSPSMSPAPTRNPPRYVVEFEKPPIQTPVLPFHTPNLDPPGLNGVGPSPTMMSGHPSPLTSPTATSAPGPPLSHGSVNAWKRAS